MKTHLVPFIDEEQSGSYSEGSSTRVYGVQWGPHCHSEAESPLLDILKGQNTKTGNPYFV